MKSKDIISFIYPVEVEVRIGAITPYLEVIKYRGKCVLNSRTVNYSFGGLQNIFDQLFQKVKINRFEFKNVLILGMGAGSIISIIREKYKINVAITAIEKDDVVIELAKKHFNIERHQLLKIINGDAYEYVSATKEKYDLIISDVFVEANVPEKFASCEYLTNLRRISNESCCIIYNKMTQEHLHKIEFKKLTEIFERFFPGSEIHKLYFQNLENSLLYYNTLPISIVESHLSAAYNQPKGNWIPILNPSA